MNRIRLYFYYVVNLLVLSISLSCVSTQELTYFQEREGETFQKIQQIANGLELLIQPGDELVINVNGLNPEVALPFTLVTQAQTQRDIVGYQVDKEGFIYFPVLGRLQVVGQKISQLNKLLTERIREYINEPVVNVRFANLRVTILGEVNRPGVISTNNEQISLLEALGQAGDVNDFGNRENILLIREQNGVREIAKINLLTTDIFRSPYYYLRQNDIIYVEPAKRKSTVLTSQQTSQILSIVTSVASFVALIVALAK